MIKISLHLSVDFILFFGLNDHKSKFSLF